MRAPNCACSRCKLFLFNNLSDVDKAEGELQHIKKTVFEDRDYQTKLIEIAKKNNIIACLPTGSGKTYIALKLMEHFKDVIFGENKKVFFLANTIPLVNQQAAFFARNSPFVIKHITGDMECDYWGKDKWNTIIGGVNVIAMTAQIFLNIIRHGIIKFSDAVLLIFDECHHAACGHPMRNIMIEYSDTLRAAPDYAIPRVLGLTATIIKGSCKTHEVPTKVYELEQTMNSTAVTYKDYEEVMKCSTSATIHKERVFKDTDDWHFYDDQLKIMSTELNEYRKRRKKDKVARAMSSGIHPTLLSIENIYLCENKATPGDLKIAVDDVRAILAELGTYCGFIALNLRLAFIEFSLMDLADGEMKNWYLKVKKFFEEMKVSLERNMTSGFKDKVDYISPKLQSLIKVLEKFRDGEENSPNGNGCKFDDGNDNSLCGLVFTDRRVTAQVLAWYLMDLSKKDNFKFIRANFVVGSSRSPFETVESRIYASKQTDTINKFRKKIYNILIATSVLEEGIDVPSCNLVVRFNTITSYTSYIQSMGRARKKNALFYALLDSENYSRDSSKLDEFHEINKAMVSHLIASVEKIDDDSSTSVRDGVYNIRDHKIEPFCPGGSPDSPRITVESGLEIIEWYCMLLPCDGISSLNAIAWWEVAERGNFKGYLKLPMNSAIKGVIQGQPAISKELAKLIVYFEAAKMLYEAKSLDENLVPVRPTFPEKVEAFFKFLTPLGVGGDEEDISENKKKEESEKLKEAFQGPRKDWYQKTVPEIFQTKNLKLGERYEIYRICIELQESNAKYPWKNLYKFDESKFGFGLMCAAGEIPDVGSFPLYGPFGILKVSLKKIPGYTKDFNIDLIKFQQTIFGDILNLKHIILERQRQMNFVIVPLNQDEKQRWGISRQILGDISSFSAIHKTRPKTVEQRQREANYEARRPAKNYANTYKDAVVVPFYKTSSFFTTDMTGNGGRRKERLVYTVDSVEHTMTPLTEHPNVGTFKQFYQSEYRTKIFNSNQPLLKCKIAGVGMGQKQLNYLLEKYAKEDEFPVYLVPELCFIIPIPASFITQLKLLPSILHRLFRLHMAREISLQVGFQEIMQPTAAVNNQGGKSDLDRLAHIHGEKRAREESRRAQRQEIRKRFRILDKPIPDKKTSIEEREIHYEFIHPNLITKQNVRDFHIAVSNQHAAKKLTLNEITDNAEMEEDGELTDASAIDLLPFDELNIPVIEPPAEQATNYGPSLLSIMESMTRFKSNDALSNERLAIIGTSFLNFAISKFIHSNFPNWNEPLMCQLRNRLLSLKYLNAIAAKKSLPELCAGGDFFPQESCWTPPGFYLPEHIGRIAANNQIHLGVYTELLQKDKIRMFKEMSHELVENFVKFHAPTFKGVDAPKPDKDKNQPFIKFSTYSHAELDDKEVADTLCALVGACFRDCGSAGAYKMLEWMGFIVPDLDGSELTLDMLVEREEDEDEMLDIKVIGTAMMKLAPTLAALEEKIGYTFKDKRLFLEAVTHPSFLGNDVSDCYQRLEFLGDAVLDVLLTTHIFSLPTHTLEELREIRSALVNSVTYASLAVRYGLQKYLLSMSKSLVDMIDNFIIFQGSVQHQVVGHFTLISDEECFGPKHVEVSKVLGDIFEALAGAIYIDSGNCLDTVWKIFYRLMQNEIDTFTEVVPKSPHRELTDKFKDQMSFRIWTSAKLRSRGREMMKITVGEYGSYYGVGTNLTRAKDAAAKIALKMIKEDDEFMKDRVGNTIMLLT